MSSVERSVESLTVRLRLTSKRRSLAERPKTRLPSDSDVFFYTVPILRQAQDRQSAYPPAFPLAFASFGCATSATLSTSQDKPWGIPLAYCLWLATYSFVSKRATSELLRSMDSFNVVLGGCSYAGFRLEWIVRSHEHAPLETIDRVCPQPFSYLGCLELGVPSGSA